MGQAWAITDPEAARRELLTCAQTLHVQFAGFDIVSDLQFGQLDTLLKEASADGAAIDVFITPLNPVSERQVVDDTPYESLRTEAFNRLAPLGFEVSYPASRFGEFVVLRCRTRRMA